VSVLNRSHVKTCALASRSRGFRVDVRKSCAYVQKRPNLGDCQRLAFVAPVRRLMAAVVHRRLLGNQTATHGVPVTPPSSTTREARDT